MIQVINRAFDILEYIANDPKTPKMLSEIAGDLNLNAGTCANILKTMVHRNYVEKMEKKRGYVLGSMALNFTGYKTPTRQMMEAAKSELQKITRQLNENSVLGILKGDKRVVLLRAQGNHDLQANTATEKRAYASATGRLLVAMLSDGEREEFLSKYGLPGGEEWPEAAEEKSFSKQIQRIRKDGYAVQITKGQIIGFAVPVSKNKRAVASLSVYMPMARYNKEPDFFVKALNASAKKIENALR